MTGYSLKAEQFLHSSQEQLDASDAIAVATAGLGYAVMTVANELRQLVAAQAPAEPEPAESVVYRAFFEAMPLGLYTTREAARTHCLADAKNHGDDVTKPQWWPQDEDDPDDSEECLVLQDAEGDVLTDYSVMPLAVATTYDPEAEG